MASIKNGTFRGLTGSFGSSYMRVRNGKQELCAKPSDYRLSMEERPKAIRANMKRLSYISKKLMSDEFFYNLWKVKEIKGAGPYNKFISKNHFGKKNTLDLAALNLSPFENNFEIRIDSFSIAKHLVEIKLKPLGNNSSIDTFREPFLVSGGILLCTGNINSVQDAPMIFHLQSNPISTNLDNPITFTFHDSFQAAWGNYKEARVLLILGTLNSEKNLVQTSTTVTCYINPEE